MIMSTESKHKLSLATPILLGIQLWLLIAICVALLALFITFLCLCRRRTKLPTTHPEAYSSSSMDRRLLASGEMEMMKREGVSDRWSARGSDARGLSVFTASEMETATNGFARDCIIAVGGDDDAILYRGFLSDNTQVAIKRLLPNTTGHDGIRCCFEQEIEGMWHVRHRNVVKLLGYSVQGPYRMLVYEYVENGNLHQWLHQRLSPLTWALRLRIIEGAAKGLAYLHEDLEPNVIHCDIKASKILLDHQWNPKISGFAHASPRSVKTDVYSFGVLIMEIVSGREPVDHKCLVDWFKGMVADQRAAYVVDPKLEEMPSSKELKRILLVALRCVDPDVNNRPTMGHVLHMLQPQDLLLHYQNHIRRVPSSRFPKHVTATGSS